MFLDTFLFASLFGIILCASCLTIVIMVRQIVLSIGANNCINVDICENAAGAIRKTDDIETDELPSITVIIPAHNEQDVISDSLECISKLDYPRDKFSVLVINDRSTDNTPYIANDFSERFDFIRVLHRRNGDTPGKPAALKHGLESVESDVIILFDADYMPSKDLALKLVAPFCDNTVGAVMGRVVPYNANATLLTKLLDLERRAGYAVDLKMRDKWGLLPQFGGTCGAIRMQALQDVGGWSEDSLAEDTDLTYRLFLNGFKVSYLNDAACYEEVPETWQIRYKQVWRWAYGHNQCLLKYLVPTLAVKHKSIVQRCDAAVILLFYIYPVLMLSSIVASLILPFISGFAQGVPYMLLYAALFMGMGNLSIFSQIAVAAKGDGQPHVLRYAPIILFSSVITMLAATHATGRLIWDRLSGHNVQWVKTKRFRLASAS